MKAAVTSYVVCVVSNFESSEQYLSAKYAITWPPTVYVLALFTALLKFNRDYIEYAEIYFWIYTLKTLFQWKGDFITWGYLYFFTSKMEQTLHSSSYGSQESPHKEKNYKKIFLTSYLDPLKCDFLLVLHFSWGYLKTFFHPKWSKLQKIFLTPYLDP